MKIAIIVIALLGAVCAQDVHIHKTRYWPSIPISDTYVLPDSAELIVGPIASTFTCIDKIYGYYADIDNECQIFHVCVPHYDDAGNQVPFVYSFFCGNQTVFDQSLLVCVHHRDALPCEESISYYSVNDKFGRTEAPYTGPPAIVAPARTVPPRPPPPPPAFPTTTTEDSRRFKVVEVLPDGTEAFVRDVPTK